MNDFIEIDNLIVFANHGVLPEEKTMGQKFVISMRLYHDMSGAAKTDDIANAINYAEVCSFVTEFTKGNRCKLIEAAAENIANALLLGYPGINRVDITLKKPWAPIGLPLDSVAVNMSRKKSIAYIGIGSNIGDKEKFLKTAITEIGKNEACKVVKVSDFIVTKPVGGVAQDDFLNGCLKLETVLTPIELLDFLHEIENAAGRTREIHWGPRTLDLDILLYDDVIMNTEKLTIPHPEMTKRGFVLEPLSTIAPYAYHPIKHDYVINLLERIPKNDNARLL